jgi:predicted ATPase/DNA-binding SARP family transcriptional activator
VRYALLGPVEVRDDGGRPVEVGGARLLALVSRLALDAGRIVTVDALVDGLWGDAPPRDAVNALQSLVSRLRRVLGAGRIESQPAGYRLVADPDDVDAARFERLAADGRRALASGEPTAAADLLTAALEMWRGPALAGIGDPPFAAAPAARLTDLRLAAQEDRYAAALTLGRHAELLGDLASDVHDNPLRDRLCALLVSALYRSGRQADALAAYDQARAALVEELGLDPGPELAAAHLAVLRGTPAPPAEPATDGNLRAQYTSFVGRDTEVGEVGKLLADGRLVTLVGPGGSGKTRLAVESGARLADRMPDGVWLVELAGVADPGEVASAALATLARDSTLLRGGGLAPRARDATERLLEQLRSRNLLLILDNCEHLVDAAAGLVDAVLAGCPQVRVLATSREPLGITGETLYPVPPLALPESGATPEEAQPSPAVRLFVDRAGAVRPGFALDATNVADVVEVCRRLDGLPLAIELAAARMRALTVGQLAERLDDRFRLLTGGSRTVLPRHRTLRAVVEWSWDLLTGDEAVLAGRLAVFAGGATLPAIERVCGGPGLLDPLTALIDKSLVVAIEDDGTEIRYRMLETIRAYAAERLTESGADSAVRAAHAGYHLELAEQAEPRLRGADQVAWLARLTAEHDNLAAALHHAIDTGDAETAVRLVAALGWFWALRGDLETARSWIRDALALPTTGSPSEARRIASALLVLANFSDWSDPTQRDKEALLRVVRDSAPGDRPGGHALLAIIEPMAALMADENDLAWAAVDRRQTHPDPWVRAVARMMRGHLRLNDGTVAAAEADFAAALEQFRAVGDRWGESATINSLGELRELRGDRPGAIAALEESLRLIRELGAPNEVLEAQARLTIQRSRAGDTAAATAQLHEIRELALRRGSTELVLYAELGLGEAALLAGDPAGARDWYRRALRNDMCVNGPPQLRLILVVGDAMATTVAGDAAGARAVLRGVVDEAVSIQDMPVLATVVEGLAHGWAGDDARRAAVLLGVARALRGTDDQGNPTVVGTRERVRTELGAAAYDAAYAQGAAMDRDAALAYCRAE